MKALAFLLSILVLRPAVATSDQLWGNGLHDGRQGFNSLRKQRTSNLDCWAADDFNVDGSWRITSASAEIYVALYGQKPFELADVAIWKQPKPGKEPGDLVVELRDLPIQWEQVGEGFGLPIISAKVIGLDIILPPGEYYFGMRLVADDEHGADAWLCTSGNGAVHGWNGGWTWWNNPPNWEPVWWYFSKPLRARLATSDFAFALYGERQ